MVEGVRIVASIGRRWSCCRYLQSYESPLLQLAQKGLEAVDAQLVLERSGLWIRKGLGVVDCEGMAIWLEGGTVTVAAAATILEDGH